MKKKKSKRREKQIVKMGTTNATVQNLYLQKSIQQQKVQSFAKQLSNYISNLL